MVRTRPKHALLARLALLALLPLLPVGGSLHAQAPDRATLAELPEGVRIRANGPAVRDQVGLSVGDVLRGGLGTILIRPPSVGLVVDATPASLRFVESRRDRLVEVPWSGVDFVDLYDGRSVPKGLLHGAGLGAVSGLALWGLVELVFAAADNPVVDEPEAWIGVTAAAGALYGAAALGDRWNRIHPRPRR